MKNPELILEKYQETPFSFHWGGKLRFEFEEMKGARAFVTQFKDMPDKKVDLLQWSCFIDWGQNRIWVTLYDQNHNNHYYIYANDVVENPPLAQRRFLLEQEEMTIKILCEILFFAYEDEIRLEQL